MLARYLHQGENEEPIAALARAMSRKEFPVTRIPGASQSSILDAKIRESSVPCLRI